MFLRNVAEIWRFVVHEELDYKSNPEICSGLLLRYYMVLCWYLISDLVHEVQAFGTPLVGHVKIRVGCSRDTGVTENPGK